LERLGELKISLYSKISVTKVRICIPILNIYLCHLFFPSCDRTQSVYKEKAACRETRVNVYHLCDYVSIRETFKKYFSIRWSGATPERKKFILGDLQPVRNAGDSPECWYTEFRNTTDRLTIVGTSANIDCLYLNGSSYNGNISVTSSGIPCQSWTEQCPHRHTMNTTYPELNNAKNYCRNPKNSGQRPWCFTTDRNKRWEYCEIPKCTPVDGNYGNWSLKDKCNVSF
ncbi:plasminogen-like, partial [Dendronephthya gigantea]|uniref:plasminogen-like n=1 Tax=Dendronephthya gigantea TaxID=151771 RepID=UPI00106BD3C8